MLENPGVFRALTGSDFSEIGYTMFFRFFPCWFIDGKNGGYVPKHRTPLMMLMPVDAMSWGVTHVTPHNPHITTLLSTFIHLSYGYGSKPWYLVNPKIAGKWMFIPLKMVLIGIDPYPYLEDYHDPFWRWPDQAQKKDGLVLAWYWNAICSRCRKPRVGETLDLLEATQELAFGIWS